MQLRTLTLDEITQVSGGDNQTPIVITASSLVSAWVGAGLLDNGATEDNFSPDTGDGGTYAQAEVIAPIVIGIIASYLADAATHASEREERVSATFNPAQVVSRIDGMDKNGTVDHGWQMQDGSMFFDTDHNGVPDLHMWTDPVGDVWADTGNGKTLIASGG